MKAIELLKNQENIIPIEINKSKHVSTLSAMLTKRISYMNEEIIKFADFYESQTEGELMGTIVVAKSLAEFFKDNKFLKLELVLDALKAQEKSMIGNYYVAKNNLLDTLRQILKDSSKEPIISAFDLFGDEFVRCESGHEIIILGGRNTAIIETLIKEFDSNLIVNGNFDNIAAQNVDYNEDTLNRNIELCTRKNNEINGSKGSKLSKLEGVIDRLKSVGSEVVAFYTYKDTLLDIGVPDKGIKAFESELSKLYIPLKKTLQKELSIELEDICNVQVDESQFEDSVLETPVSDNLADSPVGPYSSENSHINPFVSEPVAEQPEVPNTSPAPELSSEPVAAEPSEPATIQPAIDSTIQPTNTTSTELFATAPAEPAAVANADAFNVEPQPSIAEEPVGNTPSFAAKETINETPSIESEETVNSISEKEEINAFEEALTQLESQSASVDNQLNVEDTSITPVIEDVQTDAMEESNTIQEQTNTYSDNPFAGMLGGAPATNEPEYTQPEPFTPSAMPDDMDYKGSYNNIDFGIEDDVPAYTPVDNSTFNPNELTSENNQFSPQQTNTLNTPQSTGLSDLFNNNNNSPFDI